MNISQEIAGFASFIEARVTHHSNLVYQNSDLGLLQLLGECQRHSQAILDKYQYQFNREQMNSLARLLQAMAEGGISNLNESLTMAESHTSIE